MSDPGCTLTMMVERIVDDRLRKLGLMVSQDTARDIRIKRGMSITELADLAGVSTGYISDLENGHIKHIGSRKKGGLERIAEQLNVSGEEYRAALLRSATCQRDVKGAAMSGLSQTAQSTQKTLPS